MLTGKQTDTEFKKERKKLSGAERYHGGVLSLKCFLCDGSECWRGEFFSSFLVDKEWMIRKWGEARKESRENSIEQRYPFEASSWDKHIALLMGKDGTKNYENEIKHTFITS